MGTDRSAEKLLIAKDKMLGKCADVHERWPRIYRGVSADVVRKVRVSKGLPPWKQPPNKHFHPMRDMIASDPLLGQVADRLLAVKYECSRHLVMSIRKEVGVKASAQPTKKNPPLLYIPAWQSALFNRWKRPAGIDRHLEMLREIEAEV